MPASQEVAEFLGLKALAIIHELDDVRLKERIFEALHLVADAFSVVHHLELGPHELANESGNDLGAWNALAPDVRAILVAVSGVARRLPELFHKPEVRRPDRDLDLDLAFDLMETGSPVTPIRDRRELEIDEILESLMVSRSGTIGTAIDALCGMLAQDLTIFGQRLRNPALVSDRWMLLAELHELKSKCGQCLEALAAAILTPLTQEDLEDMLPHFSSSASRAVRLRRAVVDLGHAVDEANRSIAVSLGGTPLESLADGLSARLERFATHDAYRFIRPLDKREIIQFRLFLRAWKSHPRAPELRQRVEGFAKFLEVMRAINRREELKKHDRRQLQTARLMLQSKMGYRDVAPHLDAVYGRSPELDACIRRCMAGAVPPPAELLRRVSEAEAGLG